MYLFLLYLTSPYLIVQFYIGLEPNDEVLTLLGEEDCEYVMSYIDLPEILSLIKLMSAAKSASYFWACYIPVIYLSSIGKFKQERRGRRVMRRPGPWDMLDNTLEKFIVEPLKELWYGWRQYPQIPIKRCLHVIIVWPFLLYIYYLNIPDFRLLMFLHEDTSLLVDGQISGEFCRRRYSIGLFLVLGAEVINKALAVLPLLALSYGFRHPAPAALFFADVSIAYLWFFW